MVHRADSRDEAENVFEENATAAEIKLTASDVVELEAAVPMHGATAKNSPPRLIAKASSLFT